MGSAQRIGTTPGSGFSLWRLGLWLVLLLAAFGCMQYLQHAQLLWPHLGSAAVADAGTRTALRTMLAWDIAYFLLSFALIVLSAGGILRQAWARTPLRVALVLLALWMLASALLLWRQWHAWQQAQSAAGAAAAALAQGERGVVIALALKTVAVPLLLWLAWILGRPSVRNQFRRRR